MSSEHRNRTNKAQAIAAALVTVGLTSTDADTLGDAAWNLAAQAGWYIASAEGVEGIAATPWTTVSDATRTEVVRMMAADEAAAKVEAEGLAQHEVDDVFANIAAATALPAPAQDPDAAPVVREVAGEWRVYSGGSFTGFGERDDAEDYAREIAPQVPRCEDCGHEAGDHDSPLVTAPATWDAEGVTACTHEGCGCRKFVHPEGRPVWADLRVTLPRSAQDPGRAPAPLVVVPAEAVTELAGYGQVPAVVAASLGVSTPLTRAAQAGEWRIHTADRMAASPLRRHPAADHTLTCWATNGGRTGCSC